MESRLIYSISKNKRISWIQAARDGPWIFFGNDDYMQKDIVFTTIAQHLSTDFLFVAWTRGGSFEVQRENIAQAIEHLLGIDNFFVWTSDFNSVIEFNRIGVLRCGINE